MPCVNYSGVVTVCVDARACCVCMYVCTCVCASVCVCVCMCKSYWHHRMCTCRCSSVAVADFACQTWDESTQTWLSLGLAVVGFTLQQGTLVAHCATTHLSVRAFFLTYGGELMVSSHWAIFNLFLLFTISCWGGPARRSSTRGKLGRRLHAHTLAKSSLLCCAFCEMTGCALCPLLG